MNTTKHYWFFGISLVIAFVAFGSINTYRADTNHLNGLCIAIGVIASLVVIYQAYLLWSNSNNAKNSEKGRW